MTVERHDIKPGDHLFVRPSGLIVEVRKVHEVSATVRFPRGNEITVLLEHLDRQDKATE